MEGGNIGLQVADDAAVPGRLDPEFDGAPKLGFGGREAVPGALGEMGLAGG